MKDVHARRFVVAVLVAGWMAGPGHAQDAIPRLPAAGMAIRGVIDVANEAERQQAALLERFREQIKASLALQISELQQVCQLTPPQRQKLEVAAKGVVERTMEQVRQLGEQQAVQPAPGFLVEPHLGPPAPEARADELGGEEPRDADVAEAAVNDQARAAQLADLVRILEQDIFFNRAAAVEDQLVFRQRPNGHFVIPNSGLAVRHGAEKHDIWVKALENTLNAEQQQQYQEHRERREQFRRRAMIQAIVAELDGTVLLTERQREQVLAGLHEESERLLDGSDGILDSLTLLQQLPPNFFAGMLTDAQLTCIEKLKEIEVFQIVEEDEGWDVEFEMELPADQFAPPPGIDEDDDDPVR
jgi:hypothetical protein